MPRTVFVLCGSVGHLMWVGARLATSTCQLRHDQMEQGPTGPHAGRSTFLLSSGGAGGAGITEWPLVRGPSRLRTGFPCQTLVAFLWLVHHRNAHEHQHPWKWKPTAHGYLRYLSSGRRTHFAGRAFLIFVRMVPSFPMKQLLCLVRRQDAAPATALIECMAQHHTKLKI